MHMGPYISSTQGYVFRKNGKPCHDQMTRSCEVVKLLSIDAKLLSYY